ncbi:MAG TPA: hypothetical protein DD434_13560 [Bacteroidales bacterium]|nr:hypothetical protein [Bacteroidales bacterium]
MAKDYVKNETEYAVEGSGALIYKGIRLIKGNFFKYLENKAPDEIKAIYSKIILDNNKLKKVGNSVKGVCKATKVDDLAGNIQKN